MGGRERAPPMPVFFFDWCARGCLEADEAGLELASAEAAYLEACSAIPGLTAELLRFGDHPKGYAFVVTDEVGRVLFKIPSMRSTTGRFRPDVRDRRLRARVFR
jgi:hypothetical protein